MVMGLPVEYENMYKGRELLRWTVLHIFICFIIYCSYTYRLRIGSFGYPETESITSLLDIMVAPSAKSSYCIQFYFRGIQSLKRSHMKDMEIIHSLVKMKF